MQGTIFQLLQLILGKNVILIYPHLMMIMVELILMTLMLLQVFIYM